MFNVYLTLTPMRPITFPQTVNIPVLALESRFGPTSHSRNNVSFYFVSCITLTLHSREYVLSELAVSYRATFVRRWIEFGVGSRCE
ncbi:hypothetical protein CVT25_000133 [Psilocybe cyanescens]|uniref:Uncharacterized protein n=1 Tax=Psilocybe cyanescens TaxID=93625 RepID=A0A409XQ54_PSICY|nr:hypothetical protein CVT25_000133 [Psilocybe cyanescens]